MFGGAAGSLFFLLYRRSPELRRLFGFREKIRFVDVYGLWERQWNQKEPTGGEAGKSVSEAAASNAGITASVSCPGFPLR